MTINPVLQIALDTFDTIAFDPLILTKFFILAALISLWRGLYDQRAGKCRWWKRAAHVGLLYCFAVISYAIIQCAAHYLMVPHLIESKVAGVSMILSWFVALLFCVGSFLLAFCCGLFKDDELSFFMDCAKIG